jgi:hypothetical protein
MTKSNGHVFFIHILENPHPFVESLVSINSKINMTWYYRNIEMKTVVTDNGKIKFPLLVDTVNVLEETLTKLLKFSSKKHEEKSVEEKISLVEEILSSVSTQVSDDKKRSVYFFISYCPVDARLHHQFESGK